MAVYASELDFAPVDVNRVADDFLILETDSAHTDVVALPDDERIEIRLLRAPEVRLEQELKSGIGLFREICNLPLIRIVEGGRVTILQLQLETPVFISVDRTGFDVKVPDSVLRHGPKRNVTENPRITRHILIFEIAAVAPAVNLDGESVFAFLDEIRNVELTREFRIFGITDLSAVYPDVVGAVNAVETKNHAARFPVHGERELSAVGRNGIVVVLAALTVADTRPIEFMGITPVNVAGAAEAVKLDACGNGNRKPIAVVEVFSLKPLNAQLRISRPGELPRPVKRHAIRAIDIELIRERVLLARQRHGIRSRRKPVP